MERQRLSLPASTNPLQTFKSGSPLGDTRFLNFGANIDAVLVGDDYVEISAAATAPEFDAICDSSLTASQPADRLFKGIGEALTYLRTTAGLIQRAIILVRQHPTSSASNVNRYIENAAVTTVPNNIFLFGSTPNYGNTATLPIWDHNGWAVNCSNIYCKGLNINGYANTSDPPAGVGKTTMFLTSGNVLLEDCVVDCNAGLMTAVSGRFLMASSSGTAILNRCAMANGWFAFTEAYGCTLRYYTAFTYNPSNGTRFVMDNCVLEANTLSSAAVTWTLPATTIIRNISRSSGSAGVVPVWNLAQANGYYHIECPKNTDLSDITSSAGILAAELSGYFNNVTIAAPSSGSFHKLDYIDCQNLDLTGPAVIDAAASGTVILRGVGTTGHVLSRQSSSSGQAISFVNADRSHIDASGDPSSASSGTHKPWAFDASSDDNLLVWHTSTGIYANAGTDAGARNRVLPEGAGPITINGHVIEDEGTPLTQRANMNFVGAGVTVTDNTPDTDVTIPGVGTPTAGWGSITNVTTDRAYDADSTTVNELADVLGSLIADLLSQGVIAT